jgi:archaemetzincin
MLSFVFGQAQVGGAAALVSVARLRQEFYGIPANDRLTIARAIKECVHETGHTFGLTHCPDTGCPMSLSNTIRQVDDKGDELCGNCSIRLEESITTLRPRLRRAGGKEN